MWWPSACSGCPGAERVPAVDFAFTDEQDALRAGVRTVLDTECSPDALRAFELADEAGRAELGRNRWAVLAELGAPALVVPEAANGLGLGDVDLVGVLEEAGRACLPEPLLETAALAATTRTLAMRSRASGQPWTIQAPATRPSTLEPIAPYR